MNSPLGKYSQAVAAGLAVAIIGAWIAANFLAGAGILSASALSDLKTAALIALGAVFGSAATVNGLKAPVDAAHRRLDAIGAPGQPKATDIVHDG